MRIISAIVIILILAAGGYILFLSLDSTTITRKIRTSPTLTPEMSESTASGDTDIPPPFVRTVTAIDDTLITVSGPQGEMVIPKDPEIVSVSRKRAEGAIDASLSDIAVGNTVEVTVIIPGEKVQLMLLDNQ